MQRYGYEKAIKKYGKRFQFQIFYTIKKCNIHMKMQVTTKLSYKIT